MWAHWAISHKHMSDNITELINMLGVSLNITFTVVKSLVLASMAQWISHRPMGLYLGTCSLKCPALIITNDWLAQLTNHQI